MRDPDGGRDVIWLAPARTRDGRRRLGRRDAIAGLGAQLAGRGDASLLLVVNTSGHAQTFQLPAGDWRVLLDSSGSLAAQTLAQRFEMPARALLLATTTD